MTPSADASSATSTTARSSDSFRSPSSSASSSAYYLLAEALTNVAKYACASCATVEIKRSNGTLIVEIADDGVGGANSAAGSGLRGLTDRIEALGGRLRVASPAGGGTRLRAELPCE